MQDNSKHNYDPELVDRGWSLLEKQLNEVLPQKPKRRFAWFWLPLLLALTTLTGTGLYMASQEPTNNSPQAPLSSEQNNQPIAQIKNNTLNESVDKEINQAEITDIAVNDYVNSDATPAAINSAGRTNKEADRNLDSGKSNTNIAEIAETNSDINRTIISANVAVSGPAQVIQEVSFDDQAIEIAKPKPLSKPRLVAAVAVLPQLPITLLEETSPDVALDEVEILQKNRQDWRFYTEGQLTVALGDQAGLSGIAVGVDRRLGESWNMGFAFAYEQSQQKLSTSDFAYNVSQAEAAFINNSYPQAAYNVNQAYEAVSYDRFKGELQIHYQLAPRWRVGSGLSLAYYRQALVNTSQIALNSVEAGIGGGAGSVEDIVSNDERFNLFNDPVSVYEFDSISNATVGPYPLSPPNRWQMAGVLSTQYQISKHWAANLNYRRDLTKWQTTSTDFGTPSFVQFGLRYYFN